MNFQPTDTATPGGWLADTGDRFGERIADPDLGPMAYGWIATDGSDLPEEMNLLPALVERDRLNDHLLDTTAIMATDPADDALDGEAWERWDNNPWHRDVILSAQVEPGGDGSRIGLLVRLLSESVTIGEPYGYSVSVDQTDDDVALVARSWWPQPAPAASSHVLATSGSVTPPAGLLALTVTTEATEIRAELRDQADALLVSVSVVNYLYQRPGRLGLYGRPGTGRPRVASVAVQPHSPRTLP